MPSFSHPWLLTAILPLAWGLWYLQRNSFAEGTPQQHRFWLVVRCLVLLLLLFALAGLQWKTGIRRKQVVFLLDVSQSIAPEQREQAIRWINRSMQTIQAPDQAGVIVFGSEASVERFPSRPRPLDALESRVDGSGTNLENAATLADALFAENYQKNLVVVSDGGENAGDAGSRFQKLRDKGISTQALYLEPVVRTEAGVESVRFPEGIGLKQNFYLDVVTSSNRSVPALLQIYRNGTLLQEGSVTLQKGNKELLRIPQKIQEPGLYRYQVVLKPKEDFRVENNSREAWIPIQGPPRILLADENPGDLKHLAQALQDRGFQVDLKSPQGFPSTLSEMLTYQAIFMRNIPASEIHDQMPLLKQYVRDFGGGFVMLGGKKSFGPGGYYQTPIEEILPVSMDLRNKKYLADVAMVIVIDKSGSMSAAERGRQKIDLADEGGARVASLLKKTDQLGALAVDSVPKWAFPLQKLNNVNGAIDAITSIRAGGGGIYVYSGLRVAYEELDKATASVKHVILFADTADCEEKDGPGGESSLNLASHARKDQNITTTTIGIGQKGDSDVQFLEDVATIGEGRFYFTNDMFTLPEIFTQESALVQRYYLNEERFTPKIVEPYPVLSGIDSVPDLLGYVATSAKSQATVGLVSERDDPIFVHWKNGLGATAAFTSDPTEGWGAPWLGWNEFARFWAQATRILTRDTASPRFQTSFSAGGDSTTVIVESLDENGDFVNGADFHGVFLDQSGQEHSVTLLQTAPGHYEGRLPSKGTLFGKVVRLDNGRIAEESVVQYAGTENREFETDTQGKERLKQITGTLVDSPDALRFTNNSSEEIQPLQNRLLWIAAFLFLLDIAARKLSLSNFRLPERKPEAIPATVGSSMNRLKIKKRTVRQEKSPFQEIDLSGELPPSPVPKSPPPPPLSQAISPLKPETSATLERLKEAKRKKSPRRPPDQNS